MAVVNQNQEQQQGPTGGPVQVAGTSAPAASGKGATGGAAPGNVSPVQQPNANQNSGYTDVGAYINANQAGEQQLGQQGAQQLTNTYNTTMGDINNSSTDFQNSVNAGYTPENTSLISQVAANPTGAVANPNEVAGYQAQLNDTYTGPTQWNDTAGANGTTVGGYGTLQGEVAQADQEAALPTTAGGNNVLASQIEGGNASAGVNNLDALLLGAPGAATQTQAAAAPFANLGTYLDTQNTTNLGDVTAAQNNAAQASADALGAFTGANGTLTDLNTAVNNTATQDLSQEQAQQAALTAALQAGNIYTGQNTPGGNNATGTPTTNYDVNTSFLTPQQQQELGLTPAQYQQLIGELQGAGTSQYLTAPNFGNATATSEANLEQYLNQTPATSGNINAANTATADQYAETAAINQLLGSQAPTQTEALNPALASLAGTYNPTSLTQFNTNAANSDITNYITAAEQQAQNLSNQQSAAALAQHNAGGGGFLNDLENIAPWAANAPLKLAQTTL